MRLIIFERYARCFVLALLLVLNCASAYATPACPIVTGTFQLANGTTVDNSSTGWSINSVPGAVYFAVLSNRIKAEDLGGVGVWTSKVFSVAGYSSFQAAVKITAEGDQNSSEYVKIYYKIDGGSEVLMNQGTGNFGTIDFTSGVLTGNNIQLIVKIYNYNNGGTQTSKYYIEQYRVFKEAGPCGNSISVLASSSNGGVITCSIPSITLSASSTASGVTYSWTGPNSFTSTSPNPVVSTAGTYTVVGVNSTSTGSATVTVTANNSQPDLTATGGALSCGSSVTLHASSSVSGVTYSWTGPSSFTSTAQNPVVLTEGTYTVTVTNPANGCKTNQSVSVTSGTLTPSIYWLEDFSLAERAMEDTGSTAWTLTYTGTTGSSWVHSNKLVSNYLGSESVWRSQVINISSLSNVKVSIDVTGEGSLNINEDYFRAYYILNGGSEIPFINYNLDGAFANATTTSPALNGSTLQIVVRELNTASDEIYRFNNVTVSGINSSLTLTTSVSGTVTCTNTAQISVTPSGTVSSYSWTGPNGFTSTVQNPTVSAGGTYTVVGTLPSGCTVSTSIIVPQNKTAPDVTATGGSLSCAASFTLNASSSVSGVTYSWAGPNSFTSTSKNPTVSIAGTYTVTVTNPANGCTASQSVQVLGPTSAVLWNENFTFADGTTSDTGTTSWSIQNTSSGVFAVTTNEFRVNNIGTSTEGVWTSGSINIAGKTNVSIAVDLRSWASGGGALDNSGSSLDYVRLYYKLNGGSEVLFNEQLGTINGNSATYTNASIGSLSGSSLQIVIRSRTTASDEFYAFDNINVTGADQSAINASATVSGVLSCNTSSVTVSGSSTSTGVTYSWSGPGGFTASTQNISVSTAGTYTIVVTSAGGCTASSIVNVTQDIAPPGAAASVSGSITCAAASVTLSGSSSTTGVTYKWTGPNSYISTLQNPIISAPGLYTLTVTSPANGCMSTTNVVVTVNTANTGTIWLEDFTLANATTSDTGTTSWTSQTTAGTFAVSNNEFLITNITTATGSEGVWTSGVINITGKTNVTISLDERSAVTGGAAMNTSGSNMDYLRAYYKLNGGAEVLFDEKISSINNHSTTPTNVLITALSGTSLQIVIRGRATGNDEFYYVDNVKIVGTGSLTAGASGSGTLNCSTTSVALSGTSNTSGVTYSWTGPNSFTSTSQNPSVSSGGTYTLTVTNPVNGCTATASVIVNQNTTAPGATAGVSGALTCTASSVTLSGSSSTSGVTYSWSGPGGYTSTSQNPVVTAVGTYTLTTTNPANACTSASTITVTSNTGSTNTPWLEDFTLANGTISDTGTSSWTSLTSAGTFAVLNNEFQVTNIGTASGSEGVWTSGVVNITGKTNVMITLDQRSAVAGGSSMDASGSDLDYFRVYYKLNGGAEVLFDEKIAAINNHSATYTNVSVGSLSGTSLQIVVRARATGNNTEFYYFDNVKVIGATAITASTSVNGTLTCSTTSVTLSGSSNISGVTYSWAGPSSFTATSQNPVATVAGTYTLTVTNPVNGCTATSNITINQTATPPGATASVSGSLTCLTTTVTLQGSSSSSGVTYQWTGPGGFTSTAQNPTTSTFGGYTLTVTNSSTGCTSTATTTVTSNIGNTGTLWLEDFTLANGTTSDTGTSNWTSQTSAGTFSVLSNEFRVTNVTTTTGSEGVWTSGVIDITGKQM